MWLFPLQFGQKDGVGKRGIKRFCGFGDEVLPTCCSIASLHITFASGAAPWQNTDELRLETNPPRDLADPPPALQRPGQPRESRRGWRRSHSNRSPTLAAPPVAATMETTAGSSLTHFYYVPSPQAMWNKTLNRWHSLRNIKLCLCSSFLCCYSQRRITATGFVGDDLAKGKEGDRARLEREKIQRERKKSPGKEWAGG